MIHYYEVSQRSSVNAIDNALECIDRFDEKLEYLQKKYKCDSPYVFNSFARGLEFSNLWFKDYPFHLDTKNEFKISSGKYKHGYEARPRKANKNFYKDFMSGMNDANYKKLCLVLFGHDNQKNTNIEFKKVDDKYYISTKYDLVLGYREITATEYIKAME